MIDLGLSQLTDDQLVELLIEVCAEAARRDPFVREAAQAGIKAQAVEAEIWRHIARRTIRTVEQKVRDLEWAITDGVERTKREYLEQLRKDVFEFIQEEVRNGTYTPIKPEEEAPAIVAAVMDANAAHLKGVKPADFEANRKTVMNNLKRMGHSVEDIERMYGKF